MNKGIKLGLTLVLLCSHLFTKEIGILRYFDQALQQPEFVLPISAYNRIASNYFLPDFPQAQYPVALININDIQQIIRSAHATYADLSTKQWLNSTCPSFTLGKKNGYIQKILLPQGARIVFFGDLHGSMQALVRVLCKLMALGYLDKNLRLADNTYMIFLGDIVDYGHNGADTLCTALSLRTINPDRVLLCRGNHEDRQLNEDWSRGSFGQEITARYPKNTESLLNQAYRFYEQLPSAIFIGIDGQPDTGFIQCCHGGLSEESINEVAQLLTNNTMQYAALPDQAFFSVGGGCATNFNWADFTGNPHAPDVGLSARDGKRGFFKVFSIHGAQKIMQKLNIHALFRGHQDQFDCCKFLARGITEPVYPFSSAPAMIAAPKRAKLKPLIEHLLPNTTALFEQGFLLEELPTDSRGWIVAPIFTFSNATAPRLNDSEGCGLLTLSNTWEKSRLQAYIATTPTMHFRHALVGGVNTLALANTIFIDDDISKKAALTLEDHFVQAFRAFLLIPSVTQIDENGNGLIFAYNADQYKTRLLDRSQFSDQLIAKFKLPNGISPGITPEFATN